MLYPPGQCKLANWNSPWWKKLKSPSLRIIPSPDGFVDDMKVKGYPRALMVVIDPILEHEESELVIIEDILKFMESKTGEFFCLANLGNPEDYKSETATTCYKCQATAPERTWIIIDGQLYCGNTCYYNN